MRSRRVRARTTGTRVGHDDDRTRHRTQPAKVAPAGIVTPGRRPLVLAFAAGSVRAAAQSGADVIGAAASRTRAIHGPHDPAPAVGSAHGVVVRTIRVPSRSSQRVITPTSSGEAP